MLKFNRWTTWNFTFKKRASSTADFDSLNGYQIFFTIKKQKDNDETDALAVYSDVATISTAVTYKTFTVIPADTDLPPGIYSYWFRYIVGGVEKTADSQFEVVQTTTNRRS